MKALGVLSLCLILLASAHSQEQYAVRLNEKGILKIFQMVLKYNTGVNGSKTVTVPKNLYKFTLPKKQLTSNPIIPVVNEISNLNLNRDIDFYLNTSDIKITGNIDSKSLKPLISNSGPNGFDLRLSVNLPKAVVTAANLSLCENKKRHVKACGDGLKANLKNLVIKTTGNAISLAVNLRLRTDGNKARVKVISVSSNLEAKSAPRLDINFQAIEIPRIAIVINGQETELDTSRLKDEILKRKAFLGKKLMAFVADFVADDLAEMLNIYLVGQNVATSWSVSQKNEPQSRFAELDRSGYSTSDLYRVEIDNTYVHRNVVPEIRFRDYSPLVATTNPMTQMLDMIAEIVRSVRLDLSLKSISTPGNKDIELSGLVNFILNDKRMVVKDTLGNSNRKLPKLDLSVLRQNDVSLALSEPMINGALDLVATTGMFQKLFVKFANVPGFSIKNVKLHFASNNAVDAIVNAQIDLKKISSKGKIGKWFKNKIAAWLERNNNKSVIYFPIQVRVIPVVKKLATGVSLDLQVKSPFLNDGLINSYNYPSNVEDMSDMVRDGVMAELEESLGEFTNQTYKVDLSKFLNQGGVEFLPKEISINQSAYLLLSIDIQDIKFDSINPIKK